MPEQLPPEIEQKIEQLPYLPFEINEEFQNLISSKLFSEIFNYYKEHYLPDSIKTQPELYQRISLYLVLTGQDAALVNDVDQLIYRRPVPTIEEFLDHPRYLGLQNASLYPYWRRKLCEIFAPTSGINRVLWSGATGTGKAVANQSFLPTPSGKKLVSEVRVGDYLWSKNGKPTKVLGVYPQGKLDTYKVIFDDNTEVICSGDHLWSIDVWKKTKLKEPRVLMTKELLENGLTYKTPPESIHRYKYGIALPKAVEYEEKEHIIHPYLLGSLLGDGCISSNKKTMLILEKASPEVYEKILNILPKGYVLKSYKDTNLKVACYYITYVENIGKKNNVKGSSFSRHLAKLDLFGKTAKDKFIPDDYKYDSIENRLELLRGIFDTDGTIRNRVPNTRRSEISFTTISEKLAEDVMEIVRSLGGKARASIVSKDKILEYSKKCPIKGNYATYVVYIHLPYNPFFMKRKADKYIMKTLPFKRIKEIIPTGKKEECTCFEVEADDHLFLCNDYIVTHNTVTARKAVIYALYRLLCLRYPRSVLGVEEGSTLAVFVLSVTQKNAYQTNLEPLIRILSNMPCFQRVRNMNAFENFDLEDPRCPFPFFVDKANLTVVFKDNVIITLGSSIANTVGYDIVISAADEINEAGVEKGMELLNSIDGRLDSRFKSSPYIMQNVMSSARSTESVTREYAKKWANDSGFLYLHPMRFEVKEGAEFKGTDTFPILIGNGVIASRIISDPGEIKSIAENKYTPPVGCEIVQVPTIYYNQFAAQLEQQIQDILGIDTQATNTVFRDTSLLESPELNPEFTLEVNIRENTNIIDLLSQYNIFEYDLIRKQWQFKRAPNAWRYCHIDLSSGGDGGQCDTGLCILHKEWVENSATQLKDVIYVVDLLIAINAKNKVDVHSIQNFLTELVIEKNIPVHTVSADQYQSLMFLQNLEASGCFQKVEKVSVDLKLEPYTNAATLIEKGQVKIGTCPKLKKELEALILDRGKVTRTTELKDLADALVGAIWNAQLNYADQPTYEYTRQDTSGKKREYEDFIDKDKETLVDLW